MVELTPDEMDSLKHGRKIEAIASLRKRTGLGLAEAKALVEAFADSRRGPDGGGASQAQPAMMPEPDAREKHLAIQGNRIEAIKLYRNRTGCQLLDARLAIENMLRREAPHILQQSLMKELPLVKIGAVLALLACAIYFLMRGN